MGSSMKPVISHIHEQKSEQIRKDTVERQFDDEVVSIDPFIHNQTKFTHEPALFFKLDFYSCCFNLFQLNFLIDYYGMAWIIPALTDVSFYMNSLLIFQEFSIPKINLSFIPCH
jgi:hypothetical protein